MQWSDAEESIGNTFSAADAGVKHLGPHLFSPPLPRLPTPPIFQQNGGPTDQKEAFNAMLMSWFINGYHTGYYEGLKAASNKD